MFNHAPDHSSCPICPVIKELEHDDVRIGQGQLAGKGVYANKDFQKGDVVIRYHLRKLTEDEFQALTLVEKNFTHTHWGTTYLYSEPERYVNHSDQPNTIPDLVHQVDIALRDIQKDEMITTNQHLDDIE